MTELRDLFLEMFCTTKTAVDNPMIRPSAVGQRRPFLVLEDGDIDRTDGYRAEDDEDGAEGFLDACEDFMVPEKVQGRQTSRGKGR